MRPTLIIDPTPLTNDFCRTNDIAKPVFVQTFIAKPPVEALDKSVLGWLVRLNKAKLNTMFQCSLVQSPTPGLFVPRDSAIPSRIRPAMPKARYARL